MMCIVLRGEKGNALWEGLRSVEVLAYHPSEKKVEILFLLFLDNKAEDNYLEMLHPGNSHCELVKPWDKEESPWDENKEKGLPYHIDENEEDFGQSILESIYGRMFRYEEEEVQLYQKEQLNPNESFFDLEVEKEVTIWPDDEGLSYASGIEELYGTEKDKKRFIPFTSWKLGPFSKAGLALVAFKIVMQGESYDKIVGGREYFPVYGPARLRSKIKHDFIPFYMGTEQAKWQKQLKGFEDHISFRRSYDVIVLKRPPNPKDYTIAVDLDGSCEIALAARDRQPKGKCLPERYVTMDDRFKLNVYFQELRSHWRERSQVVALGRVGNSVDRKE